MLTVAEDVESIAESTFTLRGLGGSCWLRFNSTPEVFVQFDTVVVIICCRVVVWCMHSYTKNVSIFCVCGCFQSAFSMRVKQAFQRARMAICLLY